MLKKFWKKVLLKIKLNRMDNQWFFLNTNCFGLPPSFYYTHTAEEAQRIIREEQEKLYKLLDSYGKQNNEPDETSAPS